MDKNARNPALPAGHPGAGVQSKDYWSSTSYVADAIYAWGVGLYYGGEILNFKAYNTYVWPVRGGR